MTIPYIFYERRYNNMGWQMWLALIGGIVAIIGQFWGTGYWLPAIGGILAVIGAIGLMKGN
ncbi:hypothetical protein COU62_02865 [Candidatus Pacearchaeota archaeon CG10_big_fil_rev_8_21_14_0_10_35_219]|nr:MAG: hypothetical protein AUJ63_00140 [Candidatus Pacearchaeota archaeon CG1_02_35_32]PIO07637.1 MAG: hypothetical protein COU62_02865 [Candidatus Pacearchaeota archaeon CG10_big_fil_rev_8_21_14_0_10_35_219]PIY81937.1 MAG: hypothetical protein COY79_00030 [Candidatus Pacearchaeota archaeon CG_4_10_14_0_8_um_filter_35_169]PIZ80868.1 MAG: hypothetical protein COY00_00270 [Candidatus Pacearchaeota archaeon CG_4_10_14_0_2_um_filter_35_33]PJA70001.1 MAG: hypothetical protein CO155_02250 [Candidat